MTIVTEFGISFFNWKTISFTEPASKEVRFTNNCLSPFCTKAFFQSLISPFAFSFFKASTSDFSAAFSSSNFSIDFTKSLDFNKAEISFSWFSKFLKYSVALSPEIASILLIPAAVELSATNLKCPISPVDFT